MEKIIGTVIEYGGALYKVTGFSSMEDYPNITKTCVETGKYPAIFGAGKILKSGKVSKNQTIAVLFFKNGNFVRF